MPLSRRDCAILASAYELSVADVGRDALKVSEWQGSEAELFAWLEERHAWTPASAYAQNYVASLRRAVEQDVTSSCASS